MSVVRPQVVCVGGAVLDRKFHLVDDCVPGTSNPATVSTSSGGVARNVAENLAGLLAGLSAAGPAGGRGVGVELVSAVGDDEAGAALLAHQRRCGVGVDQVRVLAGEASAQYVAVLEPGGDLALGIAAMGVLDRITIEQVDAAWPASGRLFCDANLAAPVLEHLITRARGEGTLLAVDAVSTLKVARLPADLHGVDLLSCNRDEARAWLAAHRLDTGGDDRALALRVRAAGAAAVLLTRGADGVVVADASGCHEVPAVRTEVVDVTGAGDAMVAGTLAALVVADLATNSDPRPDLSAAVGFGTRLAARTVASVHSVLPDLAASSPGPRFRSPHSPNSSTTEPIGSP